MRWMQIVMDGSHTGASIEGTMKVTVHYYEGGNVQLTERPSAECATRSRVP